MKGLYTQGIAILTQQPVKLDELRPLLSEYRMLRTLEPSGDWPIGGPTAVVSYREEVNGMVTIDTVDRQWPDGMGDPKNEPTLFAAWSMGYFGPFAYPGGLMRSIQQAWAWQEAKTVVPQHRAFIRLRTTYALGLPSGAPIISSDYDSLHELDFLIGLAQKILRHPAALCYFNPNGEVLASANGLNNSVGYHRKHGLPPLDLFSNVRMFSVTPEWLLMDTVGCKQLDMADQEAAFPKRMFKPKDIAVFLQNTAFYVLRAAREIDDHDTIEGPGNVHWQVIRFAKAVTEPPREALCWVPQDTHPIPEQITNRERGSQTLVSR